MPNPHKVKIKNHKVTKNRHPVTHHGETVSFEPEQPEIIEIWFDNGSPFDDDHLLAMDPGDSIRRDVTTFVLKRTKFKYHTISDGIGAASEPEIIVDPGPGPEPGPKKHKRKLKKISKTQASKKRTAKKKSGKKGRKKVGKRSAKKKSAKKR